MIKVPYKEEDINYNSITLLIILINPLHFLFKIVKGGSHKWLFTFNDISLKCLLCLTSYIYKLGCSVTFYIVLSLLYHYLLPCGIDNGALFFKFWQRSMYEKFGDFCTSLSISYLHLVSLNHILAQIAQFYCGYLGFITQHVCAWSYRVTAKGKPHAISQKLKGIHKQNIWCPRLFWGATETHSCFMTLSPWFPCKQMKDKYRETETKGLEKGAQTCRGRDE